jgi:eukaryotic-like serine/threonine-protein kinase
MPPTTFDESLNAAFLDAFSSDDALERLVRFALDESLHERAEGDTLPALVFSLLQWAEAQARLDELLCGAFRQRPEHPLLRAVIRDACVRAPTSPTLRLFIDEEWSKRPDDLWFEALAAIVTPPVPRRIDRISTRQEPATVVVLRDLNAPRLVERLTRASNGRFARLDDHTAAAVFGIGGWREESAADAVAFAELARQLDLAEGIGIATDDVRGVEGAPVGPALDRARTLSARQPLTLDDATAAAVPTAATSLGDGAWVLAAKPLPLVDEARAAVFPAVMVGRDGLRDELVESATNAAINRVVSTFAVVGLPGYGKSRLRREALRVFAEARPDAIKLRVRAEAGQRGSHFKALQDAVEAAVGHPVAAALFDDDRAGGDAVALQDRQRVRFEMFAELLRALSGVGPLVLVVEDAHHLDASSCAAIRFACENVKGVALATWVFARPLPGFSVSDVVPEAHETRTLKLLGADDAAAILRSITGDAPQALLDRAGGHPLFLVELARYYQRNRGAVDAGSAPLPSSVEGCFLAYFDALGSDAYEMIKAASVFGCRFWREGIGAVWRAPDEVTVDALVRSLVRRQPPPPRFAKTDEFAFVSAVCQEAAYDGLDAAERQNLERRVATWLCEHPEVTAAELAEHYARGGDVVHAAEKYAEAAESSSRYASLALTLDLAKRALAIATDPRVRWRALAAADDVRTLTTQFDERLPGIAEMTALAPTLGSAFVAESLWRACQCARLRNDRDAARAQGEAARALAPTGDLRRWRLLALTELATLYQDVGDAAALAPVLTELERSLDVQTVDPWLTARVVSTLGYVLVDTGDAGRALALCLRAAEGFRGRDDRRTSVALVNAGNAQLRLGRLDDARATFAESFELARRVDNLRTVAVSTYNGGVVDRIRGDLARADAAFTDAATRAVALRHVRLLAALVADRVYLALQRGDAPEAVVALADAAVARADESGSPTLRASALACRVRARHRASLDVTEDLTAARAGARDEASPIESRAELCFAACEAGGDAHDVELARTLLDRIGAQAAPATPDDARACRDSFARRYLAPAGVVG